MSSGIKVWRWSLKHQHWYSHSHSPSVGRQPDIHASAFSQGYNDGDWAIEVEGSAPRKVIRVKASDVGPHGTLWYYHRHRQWVALVHRSEHSHRPRFLNTLPGEHGEVLIDLSHSGAKPDSGFLPYVVVKWNGERDLLQEEQVAVAEREAVNDDPDGHGQIDDNDPPVRHAIARRAAQADAVARYIDQVREKVTTGNGWKLLQTYAQMQPNDPGWKKAGEFLLQFTADLAPAPTAGTLVLVDHARLIDDLQRGIRDLIESAQADTAETVATGAAAGAADESIKLHGTEALHGIGDLLAAGGALMEIAAQIKNVAQASNLPKTRTGLAQRHGVENEAATTAALDLAKLYPTVVNGVSNVLNLHQVATEGAQTLQAIVPSVPFVGSVISLLSMARAWRKAVRAKRRKKQFAAALQAGVNSDDMKGALTYAMGKTKRKERTQATTATVAGIGSAGGIALGVTAVIGANCWNPVGWTLLGLAAVGGTGIVGYKIYKRVTRKKRYQKRRDLGQPQTPGELAAVLIKIAKDQRHPDRVTAKLMLESFGVEADSIYDSNLHETAKALIARHLK